MSANSQSARDVTVRNRTGMHARPVMKFVETALRYQSAINVTNLTVGAESLDGKSAMNLMLLGAVQGHVLRIEASGVDASEAVTELAQLVERSFDLGEF